MIVFPGYSILEQLNETSGSTVYRGKKEGESKTVVIKTLKAKHPTPSEIARFKQEFDFICKIENDGVIKYLDFIESKDVLAIVMEDFDAVSLKDLMLDGSINVIEFLEIATSIAETLGHLHRLNVIHLDIKPSNILIRPERKKVKISDFGISQILTHSNEELYNPDVIRGTLLYMSPEQTEEDKP